MRKHMVCFFFYFGIVTDYFALWTVYLAYPTNWLCKIKASIFDAKYFS